MNITKYIPSIHNWYVEQGEYKCHGCNGMGSLPRDSDDEMSIENPTFECSTCNGTGQHRNIGELLAEIAGVLVSGALNAHKCKRFAKLDEYEKELNGPEIPFYFTDEQAFSELVDQSYEDYIAQAFIKFFDLCGYLKIKPFELNHPDWVIYENINEQIMIYFQTIITVHMAIIRNEETVDIDLLRSINYLYCICKSKNIPIEKHIDARLQYMGMEI